jgi:hypothetical protein
MLWLNVRTRLDFVAELKNGKKSKIKCLCVCLLRRDEDVGKKYFNLLLRVLK